MKQRQIPWVVAALLAPMLLCQACDLNRPKPDDKFYCKVDGKHWRPNSDGDFKAITLTADLLENNRFLGIVASNYKIDETILVSIVDTTGFSEQSAGKVYELSLNYYFPTNSPSAYFSKTTGKNSIKNIYYYTDRTYSGTFRILSLEKDSRIPTSIMMRAEFEFTAVNPSGETVKITNGQFNGEVRILQ